MTAPLLKVENARVDYRTNDLYKSRRKMIRITTNPRCGATFDALHTTLKREEHKERKEREELQRDF